MKPLSVDDILDIDAYEQVRPDYRPRVIAHKETRRLAVGDRVSLVFEDRETLRYQVQEMTRVEQSRGAARIQAEIDAYNDLVPGERELSATLFIEIPELDQIRAELDRLIGIHEHVALVLDPGAAEERLSARFDPKQMEEDRISAVHYLRIPFTAEQVERFRAGVPVLLRIDHPNYWAESFLGPSTRDSLARDLAGEPVSLLDVGAAAPAAPARDRLVRELDGARVWRPAHPLAPDHHVVELTGPGASLFDLSPERWAALRPLLAELAGELVGDDGACRIWTEARADRGLRIHLSGRVS
ncbi:MAG: DUF3501 family protein [Myxococcota bacterium]